jgi:acyl-CoA hydrolase/GNAT superfamily N-acetyltransferase
MKSLTDAAWSAILRPGIRIFLGSGAGCPHALIREMLQRAHLLQDVEIVHILTLGDTPWIDPALHHRITVNSLFLGPGVREAVNEARADYTPAHLSEISRLFREGLLPIDLALVTVSPPDPRGHCSLGVSVDVTMAACLQAGTVVAQVNTHMPRTHGDTLLPPDRIDYAFFADEPLPELPQTPADDVTRRIGQYVTQLIEDGGTLQTGIGDIPGAVVDALDGPRHLGVHTEMMGDAIMHGIQRGILDNSRKTFHPGKAVASMAMGSHELYAFVHENPQVEFYPSDYINDPLRIARNDRMVAINGALQVDLTGQVAADGLGGSFHSGVGGQTDFIRGASMSKRGCPIIALPSTVSSAEGLVSRIVSCLDDGAGVVTARSDVHYVVTEYGVATLRGRSIRERVLELIQVAHPYFREHLLEQASSRHLVPSYQKLPPTLLHPVHGIESRKVRLKDGEYTMRPLHPSDERRLQEFFYSHNPETIQMRYGHMTVQMSRQRAYELVSVDQSRDVALTLVEIQGPRQIIHAVSRYYLDPDEKGAEVAFVVRESKHRMGMGSCLLAELVQIAHQRGLQRIWGQVLAENTAAAALFARHHFKPVRREEDSIIYQLDLTRTRMPRRTVKVNIS